MGVHSAKFENERVSANIASALSRYDIRHPVVNDSRLQLWNQLGITCWPTLLILGNGGRQWWTKQSDGPNGPRGVVGCVTCWTTTDSQYQFLS